MMLSYERAGLSVCRAVCVGTRRRPGRGEAGREPTDRDCIYLAASEPSASQPESPGSPEEAWRGGSAETDSHSRAREGSRLWREGETETTSEKVSKRKRFVYQQVYLLSLCENRDDSVEQDSYQVLVT